MKEVYMYILVYKSGGGKYSMSPLHVYKTHQCTFRNYHQLKFHYIDNTVLTKQTEIISKMS